MDLTTPALLFPAISLLLLAYTNRFLVTAQLIRQLHVKYQDGARDEVTRQISNLRKRVLLIQRMQAMAYCHFYAMRYRCYWFLFSLFRSRK